MATGIVKRFARIRTIQQMLTSKLIFGIVSVTALGSVALYLSHVSFDWAILIRSVEPAYLIPGYLTYSLALMAAAIGWHYIVDTVAAQHSFRRNVHVYVTTAFARRLPGSVWGIALRSYWYKRFGSDWRLIGLASVVEFWAAITSGIILALFAISTYFQRAVSLDIWYIFLFIFALVIASWHPMVRRRVLELSLKLAHADDLDLNNLELANLLRLFICESLTWVFGGLELACLVHAIKPYPLSVLPQILASWIIAGIAGTLITFLPAGFALVEVTLTALLSTALPLPVAIACAVLLRLFTTLCEFTWMVIGMAVLWVSQRRNNNQGDSIPVSTHAV